MPCMICNCRDSATTSRCPAKSLISLRTLRKACHDVNLKRGDKFDLSQVNVDVWINCSVFVSECVGVHILNFNRLMGIFINYE